MNYSCQLVDIGTRVGTSPPLKHWEYGENLPLRLATKKQAGQFMMWLSLELQILFPSPRMDKLSLARKLLYRQSNVLKLNNEIDF